MTQSPTPNTQYPIPNTQSLLARCSLIAILLLAAFLRLHRLDAVPPGLTHDEASNGHDAAAVLRGVRPIYFTIGYGHEPLYTYSVALVMSLLGTTDTALRLTTVGWGTALILLSYCFARRLFGQLPALLTAALMATSFWCVMTSRVGLRAVTLALTFTASALCFWKTLPQNTQYPIPNPIPHPWLWWTLSGAFLGVSIYTYMASRAIWAVYVLFLAYLLVLRLSGAERSLFGQQWAGIAALLLIAALVAAPLIHFLLTHPGAEQRIEQLSAPLQQAARGDFSSIWRSLAQTLPMFTFRGDPMWRYNIAGRPLLDPVSGGLFYAGILVCLYHWRDPRHAFVLLWTLVGVSPALVAGPEATVLRTIAAQPAIYVIAALALATVLRFLTERAGRWGRVTGIGGAALLVACVGLRTFDEYFAVWGEHHDVRLTYYHALVQEARYLDAQPEGGTVAFSSIYPGRFYDPYTVEVVLRRDDLSLHWFDGRFSLVLPGGGETRVIVPTLAALDEALEPILQEHGSHIHTEHLRPDDLTPRFDVYRFDAAEALTALTLVTESNPVYLYPSDVFPAGEPRAAHESLTLPVGLGDVIELVGYDLRTPQVEPGGAVELLTVWRVRAPFAPELEDGLEDEEGEEKEAMIFAHLLDDDSRVVGQVDRLDVPSYHWQPGDAFVQLHRFQVDTDAPPGPYHLEVGVYTRQDLVRLPVLVDSTAVDDRVLLSPLEVVSP
jgi:4-amino-4-deoxy-L-arabinose transferase-like glycosyltransferase